MRAFLDDFKKFLMRGNVLDLAVAVVVGVAFNAVVQSFANDILMQIVAAIFGKQDFSSLYWTINNSQIRVGAFLTNLVNFVIIAFAVYLVVKTYESLQARRRRGEEPEEVEPLTREGELLVEIRDLLREGSAR